MRDFLIVVLKLIFFFFQISIFLYLYNMNQSLSMFTIEHNQFEIKETKCRKGMKIERRNEIKLNQSFLTLFSFFKYSHEPYYYYYPSSLSGINLTGAVSNIFFLI
jgi:hypothetical protein